jgi:hypothetical protein
VGDGADLRTILIERHKAAWDDVHALDSESMRILRGEEPQILKGLEINDAEERLWVADRVLILFDKAARALMLAQEGERRAHGLDYKQQHEAQKEDEAETRRRQELTASVVDLVSTLRRTGGAASRDKAS